MEAWIFLFGFLLNFCWEVSQIPFYLGYNLGRTWFGTNTIETRATFVRVFWEATLADACWVLAFHLLVSALYWDKYWYVRGGTLFGRGRVRLPAWAGYLLGAALGFGTLVVAEWTSVTADLWGYSTIMPLICPDVGLVPVLGMTWTPPAAYALARRVTRGKALASATRATGLRLEDVQDAEEAERLVRQLREFFTRAS